MRDIFRRGMDGAELCGAGVDHRRRGMHGGGDCGCHFTGFEDGVLSWVDACSAAVGAADWCNSVNDRDWSDAEPDEHRASEICADASSIERAGIADRRESGAGLVRVSREELRAD